MSTSLKSIQDSPGTPADPTAIVPTAVRQFHELGLADVQEQDAWIGFSTTYDEQVFSLTSYPKNVELIMHNLVRNGAGMLGDVLNMGCGPTEYMNRALLLAGARVVAADFCEAMLTVAQSKINDPRVRYELADSRNLPFESAFDNVIAINSILPPERADVVSMFQSARQSLRPGGRFTATLMPHDVVLYMIKYINNNWELVDSDQMIEIDTSGRQCNHTPETLYAEMTKAGWHPSEFSSRIFYLDSPEEREAISRLYQYETGAISPRNGKPLPPWYQIILTANKTRD